MAIGNNGGSSSRGQSYGGHRAELHEVGCSPAAPSSLFLSLSAGRQSADVCRPQSPPSDMHLFEYAHVHRLAQFFSVPIILAFSSSSLPPLPPPLSLSLSLSLSTYTHRRAHTHPYTHTHNQAHTRVQESFVLVSKSYNGINTHKYTWSKIRCVD